MEVEGRDRYETVSEYLLFYVTLCAMTIARAALAISAKEFLSPEQKLIDGNVHARPVGDMFNEHMST